MSGCPIKPNYVVHHSVVSAVHLFINPDGGTFFPIGGRSSIPDKVINLNFSIL